MTSIIPQKRAKSPKPRPYTTRVFRNEPEILHHFRIRWVPWLFNTPLHVRYQAAEEVYTFVLTNADTQSDAYGFFHLFVQVPKGISPFRASFGSFEIAEHLSHEDFDEWLDFIENFSKTLGIRSITLKHYPSCYNPNRTAFIKRGLLRNSFGILQSTSNQHLAVTSCCFEEGLHASEKRRLRKCTKAGFRFEEWQKPIPEDVYQFIQHNRKSLGYSLSFSLEQFKMWLRVFPEYFRIYCVKDGDTLASLTIAVQVGEQVLYNFCPADNLSYRTFSPAVMLNKGLYDYCQKHDISLLDLGVSVDEHGLEKPSLRRFKQNLGAKNCDKLQFHKIIV